ncbi:MAG: carboxypeptidase regulatory-like domain-containing protein [Planctomycetes bacterium]|nr:carboxypeptidase regulatory-like domain-containing protein [Planctomycetota bacterium]
MGALRGRVIGRAGEPVSSATVEVRKNSASDSSILRPDVSAPPLRSVATDRNGEFSFDLPAGRSFDLRVMAEGFAPIVRTDRYAGENVLVEVGRGGTIRGNVSRSTDGTPVANAIVRLSGGGADIASRSETDPGGRYEIEVGDPGTYWLSVYPSADGAVESRRIDLEEGETVRQDIEVDPGVTFSGRVTDARSHEPIIGAHVTDRGIGERFAETNSDGYFMLDGINPAPQRGIFIRASAPDHATAELHVDSATAAAAPLEFALQRGGDARGVVIDAMGRPASDVEVSILVIDPRYMMPRQTTPAILSRADGAFEFRELRPDARHLLIARKDGFATRTAVLDSFGEHAGVADLGVFALDPPASIVGRVTRETGEPVSDVFVKIESCDRSRGSSETPLDAIALSSSRSRRTDTTGRFCITDLAAGRYRVSAQIQGRRNDAKRDIELKVGQAVDGIDLVLEQGPSISGRVVDSFGKGVSFVRIEAFADSLPKSAKTRLSTESDGSFHIEGLAEGTYTVTAQRVELSGNRGESPFGVGIARGVATGSEALQIELRRARPTSGILLDHEDQPVAGLTILVSDPIDRFSDVTVTDAEGRFSIVMPEPAQLNFDVATTSGFTLDVSGPGTVEAAVAERAVTGIQSGVSDLVFRLVPKR